MYAYTLVIRHAIAIVIKEIIPMSDRKYRLMHITMLLDMALQ